MAGGRDGIPEAPASGRTGPAQAQSSQASSPQPAFAISPPKIELPKGGGAIRGIGEKFGANPVTGTGSLSVPIATSPGRSGFGPQLSLSYDSGAGNGPFGFGWSLSLPSITRKTDKGLPKYLDAEDSDVFILSGSEDLMPVYRQDHDGSWILGHSDHTVDAAGWVRDPQGRLVIHEDDVDEYRVRRYRPRIEGLFARIERWSKRGVPGDVHWRSISKDNVLTLYGLTSDSRIADTDPLKPERIFSWLICETRDDKGNGVLYRYKPEDGTEVELTAAHQRNRGGRDDPRRTANRYLKRILYGNRATLLDGAGRRPRFLTDAKIAGADWMFEVVFDYEDHDEYTPTPADDRLSVNGQPKYPWRARPDAFSSNRSGFEIRTARTCRRVLMFHHFPEDPNVRRDCLVRSTDFIYSDKLDASDARNPVYTFLKAVTQTGYRRAAGSYLSASMPSVEFTYSQPKVSDRVEEVDPASLANLPIGLDGGLYRWTDLHGEGISGILTEQGGAWYYKRNLSPLLEKLPDGSEVVRAKFAALETVALQPNVSLSAGAEFMDLAGDGQPDVVVMDGPTPGLYEHDEGEGWQAFRAFRSRLTRDLSDPNVKYIDLDGDGHADVLITEDEAFVWHASLAEDGFGPARRVVKSLDEELGPRILFADASQSIYLADMDGDGLTDIVRVRNGDVCYWPNLGHGRFGARIAMDNAPRFDNPDQFDQNRLRLADIDGSGTNDLIYLHRDGVRLYFNQSGNGWSQAKALAAFPRIDNAASIVPLDLLGNGTSCLVWSSSQAGDNRRQMRYVALMGDTKPHLLIRTDNNLGAETHVHYASSTKFYLQDRQAGRPWITRLPFPVHVVERVETYDHVSRNRFASRYAYHHGYFDGEEREFRGFGMVEQWDTDEIGAFRAPSAPPRGDNELPEAHVPPVHTKTWFHTGVYLRREHVSDLLAREYFREPNLSPQQIRSLLLPDTVLPDGLTLEEQREACRALKGSMLRQEVYADDAPQNATTQQRARAATPYTVAEQNFTIRRVQPRGANRHGVFFTHAREAITFHYERNPSDPRTQHAFTLEVDEFGNVLTEAAVGYGRRADDASLPDDEDRKKQRLIHITCTENRYTNAVENVDTYRLPLAAEAATFELRKPQQEMTPDGPTTLFAFDAVLAAVRQSADGPHEVPYEDPEFVGARADPAEASNYFRRCIERLRTLYRSDDLRSTGRPKGLLPLGELESLALPGESYKLAFTAGLIDQVFQRQPDGALISSPATVLGGQGGDRGGYVRSQVLKGDGRFPDADADDDWWVPSGRSFLSTEHADTASKELTQARQNFFLARRYRDPFGQDTVVDFDAGNNLLVVETRDALRNRIRVELVDYRVLQSRLVSDPNGKLSEVVFDTLGLVAGSAIMGGGDNLTNFSADLDPAELGQFQSAPRTRAPALLSEATTRIVYDLGRFQRTREANLDDRAKWLPVYAATIVREMHVNELPAYLPLRVRVDFSYSDGFGREIQKKIQAEPGRLDVEDPQSPVVNPRWVGSGWTIFNNKGKPVRKYEPFFDDTHEFKFAAIHGVSPVLFYDPVERVIATLHPNDTYEKVVFDPWQQTTNDVNDTCLDRPQEDPDIAGFVHGYFASLPTRPPWKTWHARRIDGDLGGEERTAAQQAADHAHTPTTAHFDALGRPFLTVTRNRVVCADHPLDATEERVNTRVKLDIEGNQREVRDAIAQDGDPLGRIVMRYAYDMLGTRLRQESMEAGTRWMLNDVTGNVVRAWDSRGHNFRTVYDPLRRPTERYVQGTSDASDQRVLNGVLFERIEYGEPPDGAPLQDELLAQSLNLRTRVYRTSDGAGVVTNARVEADVLVEAYDYKGNLLCSTRQLVSNPTALPDWLAPPALAAETFVSRTRYDALNRVVQSVAPFSSLGRGKRNVIQPSFNDANLLERIDVWLEWPGAEPGSLINPDSDLPNAAIGVHNIDYDAKGQRRLIRYKNDVVTEYGYDPQTFRLRSLVTKRKAGPFPADTSPEAGWLGRYVQSLSYFYDPAGNITRIKDDAQQKVFFKNRRVEPSNDYVYDALYRLIQAKGREHLGQGAPIPHSYNDAGRVRIVSEGPPGVYAPYDGQALGAYTEQYVYDAVGNFREMVHWRTDAQAPGWSRSYAYNEASLIESAKRSNRLSETTVGSASAEVYAHDAHGNMLQMPQLAEMVWDFKDQLQLSRRQRVNDKDTDGIAHEGERTYYVYDASGQRVRKVTLLNASLKDERIYLGGFEIFREHGGANVERETLHVMDDKQRIALVETRLGGTEPGPRQLTRYQFSNHLGSASLELDSEGKIISYEEYSPYGSTTLQLGRGQAEVAKRYRYTGKERDEESGFYYHGARYYAAWLGRWASCDPLFLVDGTNLYLAFKDAPTLLVDPMGTEVKKPQTVVTMPSNSAQLGREVHAAVLGTNTAPGPLPQRVQAGLSDFGTASVEVRTGPGGSTTRGSNAPGRIDFQINTSRGDQTWDLKPEGRTQGVADQLFNYGQRSTGGVASRPGTDRLAQWAADALDPVSMDRPGVKRDVLLSQPDAAGQITYQVLETREVSQPVVEYKNRPPGYVPPGTSSGTNAFMSKLGNTAKNVGVNVVPGAAEGIAATEAVGLTAARFGLPRLAAAALSGAKAPGPAIVGGVVGAPAGYVVEGAARQVGLGEKTSVAAGALGAVATGAAVAGLAVLAVATAPVSVTVLGGAMIVGGIAAGFGYLTSRAMQ